MALLTKPTVGWTDADSELNVVTSAPDQECFLGTGRNFTPSSAKGFNGTFGLTSARDGLDRSSPTCGQVTSLGGLSVSCFTWSCEYNGGITPSPTFLSPFVFCPLFLLSYYQGFCFSGSILYLFTHWALMAWPHLRSGFRSLFQVMAWVLSVDADPLPKHGSLEQDW